MSLAGVDLALAYLEEDLTLEGVGVFLAGVFLAESFLAGVDFALAFPLAGVDLTLLALFPGVFLALGPLEGGLIESSSALSML
jgi:hypothetical protein